LAKYPGTGSLKNRGNLVKQRKTDVTDPHDKVTIHIMAMTSASLAVDGKWTEVLT
jgi:hypothetical protein